MANADPSIIDHASKIKEAIEITLNPQSSPKDRQKAIEVTNIINSMTNDMQINYNQGMGLFDFFI